MEKNYTGANLLNVAVRLAVGENFTVEYDTQRAAVSAANRAVNKRLVDGLKGVVKIKRWTSIDNKYYVTVSKICKYTEAIATTAVLDMPESVAAAITDTANRNMVKGMLQEGYTTMDILEGIENWSEERSLSEIEAIKLALAEQPEM